MKNIKYGLNMVFVMALLALGMFATQGAAKDINGCYFSDDGGVYYVRQVGDKLYWVGEDPKGGFANVLVGTITGTKVTAHWWDIPKGKAMGGGDIVLEIKSGGFGLAKVSSTAPFGAKNLTAAPPTPPNVNIISPEQQALNSLRSKPEGFRSGDNNLTGAWTGDDFATYYVREMPNGDVVWFAENNFWGDPGGDVRPSFARVFVGKRINNFITGNWVDLPKGKAAGSGVLGSVRVNQQEIKFNNPPVGINGSVMTRSLPNNLRGFADLHTHPMVNLGFGGKLIHGGPDVGSLLPADADCNHNVRAKSIGQALGSDKSTHGGYGLFDNQCGDSLRAAFIDVFQLANDAAMTPDNSVGYPSFKNYPVWNDISHQKMWVDWIRRSYDGGQRIMVALATTNGTLAALAAGPGDGPTDDAASADLQVKEMKDFVGRHNDFMEVAYNAADIRRIILANKMAVVLGVEIDNIGNFNKSKVPVTNAMIAAEIKRLYGEGVRYAFPVHVLDNTFGHTAVYKDLFNYSNKREEGAWWSLVCADAADSIKYKYEPFLGPDVPKEIKDLAGSLAKSIKVSLDLNSPAGPDKCYTGNKNKYGLNDAGRTAIKEMMKLGMLVDVDHMSQFSVADTLKQAEDVPGGYPVVSGHTNLRGTSKDSNENWRTPGQLARIAKLGGMFGLGSEGVSPDSWASRYVVATSHMGKGFEGRVSFGTDLNGLVKGPGPELSFSKQDLLNPAKVTQQIKACSEKLYDADFIRSKTGDQTWNFCIDGVAHYGMMADFLREAEATPQGAFLSANIMKNAEMFAQMWEKAEKVSKSVK